MRTGLRKRTDPDCRKDELCPGQKCPGQKYVPDWETGPAPLQFTGAEIYAEKSTVRRYVL